MYHSICYRRFVPHGVVADLEVVRRFLASLEMMHDDLPKIPLEHVKPCEGILSWDAPERDGRFPVSIEIPLEPFDSGITYISQPETPTIRLYDFSLDVASPLAACGRTFDLGDTEQGGSVCIGGRHNPAEVLKLTLRHLDGLFYEIELHLFIDFEFEGFGEASDLFITATVRHVPNATGIA